MVLPIQSQLAHTSNTIKIISLGLSNMSNVISSLGGLLSSAFATGLTAFNTMKSAMSGFFDEQIKGVKNLASALSGIASGSGVISEPVGSSISSIAQGGLGTKPSLGSGINDSNRHLFKFTPKENFQRFPNLSHDGKQGHTSILDIFGGGGPARHTDFSDRVKMGMAMSGSSPTYNINIEMSGMTDRSDKSKMARDISDLIQAETTRRADFHRSHGRL